MKEEFEQLYKDCVLYNKLPYTEENLLKAEKLLSEINYLKKELIEDVEKFVKNSSEYKNNYLLHIIPPRLRVRISDNGIIINISRISQEEKKLLEFRLIAETGVDDVCVWGFL